MDIIIQSVNFKAGEKLEAFIADKVRKLFRHSDHIIRAEVTLRQVYSGYPQNKMCDIRLMIPGNDHFVSKSTDVFEKSVLESVRTMQKLLHQSKPARMLQKVRSRFYKVFSK